MGRSSAAEDRNCPFRRLVQSQANHRRGRFSREQDVRRRKCMPALVRPDGRMMDPRTRALARELELDLPVAIGSGPLKDGLIFRGAARIPDRHDDVGSGQTAPLRIDHFGPDHKGTLIRGRFRAGRTGWTPA